MVEEIHVSAVVLRNEDGGVLTVRKRGTRRFMFPGGKPKPGESAADTAVREAREEVGVELDPHALHPLGTFRADAANEDGAEVVATVFTHPAVAVGEAAGEIEEIRWQPLLDHYPDDVAPLLAHHVLPALLDPQHPG